MFYFVVMVIVIRYDDNLYNCLIDDDINFFDNEIIYIKYLEYLYWKYLVLVIIVN